MNSRLTRWLFVAGSAFFLSHAAAQGGPPGGKMPPTPVEVAQPVRQAVSKDITAVGTLRAAESVTIKPELAGRIEKIHFQEGQSVKAGQPLFTMDASLIRAEVQEWQATVAQTQREVNRAQDLIQRKLIAQNDLDSKKSDLAVNQARLSSARTRLGKTTIEAPFEGIVGLRNISQGEYVNAGDVLVSLVKVDPIKLDFRLPEIYLSEVRPMQEIVVFSDAYKNEKFIGRIEAIDPQLDSVGRNIVLRALVENDAFLLKPGLFARVQLSLGRRENALLVPEQALWPQGDKQFVYVVEDGKAKLVEVQIGIRKNGMVEITKGLDERAEVITAGQVKIGPDMPVVPLKASNKPPAKAAPRA